MQSTWVRQNKFFSLLKLHPVPDRQRHEHSQPWLRVSESPEVIKLSKRKKSAIEETRNTEIERSNRILLQKITKIFSRSKTEAYRLREKKTLSKIASPKNFVTQFDIDPQKLLKTKKELKNQSAKPRQRYLQPIKTQPQHRMQNKQPANRHILYRGSRVITGKQYYVQIYIQKGEFIFRAEEKEGDLVKYLSMSEEDFRTFRCQNLPKGIISLFEYIRIGDVVQLQGLNNIINQEAVLEMTVRDSPVRRYN